MVLACATPSSVIGLLSASAAGSAAVSGSAGSAGASGFASAASLSGSVSNFISLMSFSMSAAEGASGFSSPTFGNSSPEPQSKLTSSVLWISLSGKASTSHSNSVVSGDTFTGLLSSASVTAPAAVPAGSSVSEMTGSPHTLQNVSFSCNTLPHFLQIIFLPPQYS